VKIMNFKVIVATGLAGLALSLAPTISASAQDGRGGYHQGKGDGDRHRGDRDHRRHGRGDYYGDGCASYERPHHGRRGGYGGGGYGRR
jgi:hypothetical protein